MSGVPLNLEALLGSPNFHRNRITSAGTRSKAHHGHLDLESNKLLRVKHSSIYTFFFCTAVP